MVVRGGWRFAHDPCGAFTAMRGCVLRRIDAEGTYERTVDSADDWYDVLADVFHLNPADVAAPERLALWQRVRAAHQEWGAAGERAAATS